MFVQLSDIEKKVLKALAQKGKATGYEICTKRDKTLNRASTHDALKVLERKKLVEMVSVEKHKPKDKLVYDITLQGLLVFFSAEENWLCYDDISDVARLHSDLIPLVFGNWTYFVRAGVRDEVITRLRKLFANEETANWLYRAAMGMVTPPRDYNEAQMDRLGEYTIQEQITKRVLFEGLDPLMERIGEYAVQQLITRHVIFLGLDPRLYNLYEFAIEGKPQVDPDVVKWVIILASNDELKRYALRHLKHCREDFKYRLKNVKLWVELIRTASKSLPKSSPEPLSRKEEKMLYDIHRRIFE